VRLSREAAACVSCLWLIACTPDSAPASGAGAQDSQDSTRPGRTDSWGGLSVERRGDEDADCALVLLHGYGAPGDDLVPLGSTVARASGCLAVMPAAPEPVGSGRQWWSLDDWRRRRAAGEDLSDEVPEGLADASRRVQGVIRTLSARGVDSEHIVLAGFSQGAMLALDAGLSSERPLGGIVVLSGTLIARSRWAAAIGRGETPPVLMTHGRSDSLLTFDRADALRRFLVEEEVPVTLVPFAGGHAIPAVARERLIGFVRARVGDRAG